MERNSWLREGKNWAISNAMTLVWHCLSHPAQIMWVRYTPVSVVDLCLTPPSWLGSKKLLVVMWNCSLLLTTFSISLPIVLRRTMGQKKLGVLCEVLFGLGITTELDNLKWEGQCSNVMQALAIYTNFSRHVLYEIMALRCLHDTWSGPGVEDDEHLAIVSLNSWLEKGGHSTLSAWGSLLRSLVLTSLFSAELYDLYRVFHRSRRVLHGQFLYKMDLMAGRDFLLTQLIRSQGLLLDDVILWILLSKNSLLTVHTTDLNSFQCLSSPDSWYLLRPSV